MWSFEPQVYGPAVAPLLELPEPPPLGPGSPRPGTGPQLEKLSVEQLLDGRPPRDPQMAACCLAGLWLLHNHLDQSHTISQSVETPSGSYWHGIMHRREPDYANAKYWFRRVGEHPVFRPLVAEVRQLASDAPPAARFLAEQSRWKPFDFVDLCEQVARHAAPGRTPDPSTADLARRVAQLEWQMLFDYCYREAAGIRDFAPGASHDR